jgi:putative heme utilization carrier protein HutX
MSDSTVSSELGSKLAADPGVIIETIAKEYDVTLRQVVDAFHADMRKFAPGATFIEVMTDVANWGVVTVIINTDDGVMEFTGPVPSGKIGHGYYNLGGSTGFHGHLRHERCAGIAFLERPLFGRLSAAILFFNLDGGVMFKIFVGRDEKRELLADQLAAFRSLAGRLCSPQRRQG